MLPEGTVLGGDYRLLKPLSSGGMGSVHLAEQVSTGTRRALKLMHQQLLQNARARERFVQEAKASGRIPSDHVVQVVAAGVDNELSVPFIVMELLEGETLERRVERGGPLTPEELREVTEQLFHAMCAAHEVGVVHRDLKPENVFLARARRARAQITVKVLDFGIAKLLAEVSTARTAAIGTPLWMAPEQSDADHVVSPATDVWALGLLYFYLFVGKPYWRTAEAGNLQATMREVLFEPLAPASERAAQIEPSRIIPDGFDAVFARSVVRDQRERFPDARAMLAALEPVISGARARIRIDVPSFAGLADDPTEAAETQIETLHGPIPLLSRKSSNPPETQAVTAPLPEPVVTEDLGGHGEHGETVTIRKPLPEPVARRAPATNTTTQPMSFRAKPEKGLHWTIVLAALATAVGAAALAAFVLRGVMVDPGPPPPEVHSAPGASTTAVMGVTPLPGHTTVVPATATPPSATAGPSAVASQAPIRERRSPASRPGTPSASITPEHSAPIGTGTLRVGAKPGFCSVTVDGQAYGPTPVAITVAAGKRNVTCTTESGASRSRQVEVEAEKTARVLFELGG